MVDGKSGMRSVVLLQSIYKSIESGKEEKLMKKLPLKTWYIINSMYHIGINAFHANSSVALFKKKINFCHRRGKIKSN